MKLKAGGDHSCERCDKHADQSGAAAPLPLLRASCAYRGGGGCSEFATVPDKPGQGEIQRFGVFHFPLEKLHLIFKI